MLFSLYTITIVISAFLFSWAGSHIALYLLSIAKVLDKPNERSNHEAPVPRGGGVAVIISALSFLFIAGAPANLLIITAGIAMISFLDDYKGVQISWRLLIQIMAVFLLFMPNGLVDQHFNGLIFQSFLSPMQDKLLAGFLLLGFMNLFNFMDGIDGITGAQTFSIGVSLFVLSFFAPHIKMIGLDGLVLASASVGFLLLNWHPAKLFLGDVGSVSLGFLLGFLLLSLAADGYWIAALLLPSYYLIDGGLTFIKRLLTGQKVWQAHSQHAYQKAVRAGFSHAWVVKRISLINSILAVLAIGSVLEPAISLYMLIGGYGLSFIFWLFLLTAKKPAQQTVLAPA